MSERLPPNPFDSLSGEYAAYGSCLNLEAFGGSWGESSEATIMFKFSPEVAARVLGYALIHSPSKVSLAGDIFSCSDNAEFLAGLSYLYVMSMIRTCTSASLSYRIPFTGNSQKSKGCGTDASVIASYGRQRRSPFVATYFQFKKRLVSNILERCSELKHRSGFGARQLSVYIVRECGYCQPSRRCDNDKCSGGGEEEIYTAGSHIRSIDDGQSSNRRADRHRSEKGLSYLSLTLVYSSICLSAGMGDFFR